MASDPPLRERRMIRGWAHGFRSSLLRESRMIRGWAHGLRSSGAEKKCGEEEEEGSVSPVRSFVVSPCCFLMFLNVREKSNAASLILFNFYFLCYIFVFHDWVFTSLRSIIPFFNNLFVLSLRLSGANFI
jgi:hypothetical protein